MSKDNRSWQKQQTTALEDIKTSMAQTAEGFGELSDNVEKLTGVMVAIATSMKVDLGDNLDDASDSIKKFAVETRSNTNTQQEHNRVSTLVVQNLRRLAVSLAEHAQAIQSTKNDLVRTMSITEAQSYAMKDRVETVVNQMNDNTLMKTKYATDKVFQEMSKIFASTSTRDAKTLDAVTGPLTLASQTLSIDMGRMTTMFSRFYTRYTFSSEAMNDTLESILQNTSDNNVSQEKLQENIATLSTVAEANARYQFGGDTEALSDYMAQFNDAVATASARYEAVGLDTSNVINDLNDIMQGNVTAQLSYLSDGNIQQIKQLMQEGTMESVNQAMDLMMSTRAEIGDRLQKSGVGKLAAGNIGVDNMELLATANAVNSGSIKSLEEWLSENRTDTTLLEQSDQKFVGIAESAQNFFSNWADDLADVLQTLGISGDDLRNLLTGILGVSAANSLAQWLGGLLGGGGGAGGISSILGGFGKLAGLLGETGPIVSALAPVAAFTAGTGVALAVAEALDQYGERKRQEQFGDTLERNPTTTPTTDTIKTPDFVDTSKIPEYTKPEDTPVSTKSATTGEDVSDYLMNAGQNSKFDRSQVEAYIDYLIYNDPGNSLVQFDGAKALADVLYEHGMLQFVDKDGDGVIDDHSWPLGEYDDHSMIANDDGIFYLDPTTDAPTNKRVAGTYRTGLRSVPYDNYLANLHEGERVLTSSEAESLRKLGNLNDVEDMYKDRIKNLQASSMDSAQMSGVLDSILSLLIQWKEDSESNMRTNERLSRLSYATQKISQYEVVG